MATVKERTEKIGTTENFYQKYWWSNPVESSHNNYGTLLDFTDVAYKGQYYSGTFNPAEGNELTVVSSNVANFKGSLINVDSSHVAAFKGMLLNPEGASLGIAQTAVDKNATGNQFFNEYFKYYLDIAQERQKNLQKTFQRQDLLSTGSLI